MDSIWTTSAFRSGVAESYLSFLTDVSISSCAYVIHAIQVLIKVLFPSYNKLTSLSLYIAFFCLVFIKHPVPNVN